MGSVRSLLLVPSAVTESEPNDNLPKHEPTSRTISYRLVTDVGLF